jgi:hypothetical protein
LEAARPPGDKRRRSLHRNHLSIGKAKPYRTGERQSRKTSDELSLMTV